LCAISGAALAADKKANPAPPATRETVAKPITDKERKQQLERQRKELENGPYRRWLDEDVGYIISGEERAAFKNLATDDERESFIEQFWLRRDPTPDTDENEFREEHYRRMAYANDRFASGIPGWKTDRGRIYIMYGPPDEIDAHTAGGTYARPIEEGGGVTSAYPFEIWRYRYIEDIGTDIRIEFLDKSYTGEYRITMDPGEKDALLYVPDVGLTMSEELGLSSKEDRLNRYDMSTLGTGSDNTYDRYNMFRRLEQYVKLQKPPATKFKDLEAIATSRITYNVLPMRALVDYFRLTDSTVLTYITLQFDRKDLQFQLKDGMQRATVNIYASISTMARKRVQNFDETVLVEELPERLEEAMKGISIFSKTVPLAPGTYRLNVVAKDLTSGNVTNFEEALHVPRYDEETLASSTLILADVLEKVPTRSIGTGPFVIGSSKVRPRLNATFGRGEKLGIYAQFYNFGADEQTRKPNGSIQYEVIRDGSNERIFDFSEDLTAVDGASANQVTVEKLLPLQSLEPGKYSIKVTATDRGRNQKSTVSGNFTVF
jgi:GWxTD domain-containing protein